MNEPQIYPAAFFTDLPDERTNEIEKVNIMLIIGEKEEKEVIVDEKRVWNSAEVRGWCATRELVSVQEGSKTVPISDAIWREIQREWDESTDSDIDTDGEDGDLCLEEWADY